MTSSAPCVRMRLHAQPVSSGTAHTVQLGATQVTRSTRPSFGVSLRCVQPCARVSNWYEGKPKQYVLKKAKARAKRKGIEFSLTEADIVFPKRCPIMGVPFNYSPQTEKEVYYGPSIDRIDNALGYIPGNIRIISYLANVCRWQCDETEIRAFCVGTLAELNGDRPWHSES